MSSGAVEDGGSLVASVITDGSAEWGAGKWGAEASWLGMMGGEGSEGNDGAKRCPGNPPSRRVTGEVRNASHRRTFETYQCQK